MLPATPREGSSTSEGPGVIQSTATPSDDLGGIVTQSTSPNTSLLSIITGRVSDSDGLSKSEGQSETQNSSTVTTTLR